MLTQVDRLAASLGENGHSYAYHPDALYESLYDKLLSQCRIFIGDPEAFDANFRMFERLPASFRKRKRRRFVQLQHLEQLFRKRLRAKRANSNGGS